MSPEHIEGTDMWNLLPNEELEGTDGRKVEGPIAQIRISHYEERDLMSAHLPDGNKLELLGNNFSECVKKKDSNSESTN